MPADAVKSHLGLGQSWLCRHSPDDQGFTYRRRCWLLMFLSMMLDTACVDNSWTDAVPLFVVVSIFARTLRSDAFCWSVICLRRSFSHSAPNVAMILLPRTGIPDALRTPQRVLLGCVISTVLVTASLIRPAVRF
jgi:hypothetical protein